MKKRIVVLSILVCTMLFGCQKTQGPFETDNFVSDRYAETDFDAIEERIGTDVQNLFDGDRIIEKVTYWGDERSEEHGRRYDDAYEWTPTGWIVMEVKFEGHPDEGYKMAYKKNAHGKWELIEYATGWG
ncbi:hypothetical protein QUV96_06300 [Amedibacillus dolichus]|uniref:Lipoprotein n=1 Tax=Amedibacillus dolichus TaxID=31971 RepID=A0ABT7UC77_9FIRM|nr:hypothetical protein [Amedibacillus dolichus]MDM8157247.1 hypothetical protein [Amedibacillus dolichus]